MTHIMLMPVTMNERSADFERVEMFKTGLSDFIEGCLQMSNAKDTPMFDIERSGNIITVKSPMGFKFNIMPMYVGKAE